MLDIQLCHLIWSSIIILTFNFLHFIIELFQMMTNCFRTKRSMYLFYFLDRLGYLCLKLGILEFIRIFLEEGVYLFL